MFEHSTVEAQQLMYRIVQAFLITMYFRQFRFCVFVMYKIALCEIHSFGSLVFVPKPNNAVLASHSQAHNFLNNSTFWTKIRRTACTKPFI
jgi:hypothetical protein